MGTLQLKAIEEQWSRLPSWPVLLPSQLPKLMLTPGTSPMATPTGTTTGWATTTGTCTTTGTDLVCRRDTDTTTARGPLRPSLADADAWYRSYGYSNWGNNWPMNYNNWNMYNWNMYSNMYNRPSYTQYRT